MSLHRDIEMNTLKLKEDSLALGSSYSMREPVYDERPRQGRWDRFLESFRRDPDRQITPKETPGMEFEGGRMHNGAHYYDIHLANLQTAQSGLARKLKGRHLQMIAIGGSIGMPVSYISF
jgi:yeast amino acid transporter